MVPDILDRLAGRTLISRVFAVLRDAEIRPVVVVVPEERVLDATAELGDGASVMAATADRRSSMLEALSRIRVGRVVVLDHTYPLATPDQVRAVVDGLDGADACVAAVPAMETLKLVEDGVIDKTVDRAELWHLQMPQGFRSEALIAAHHRSAEHGLLSGDDVVAVDRSGGRVRIVVGSRDNLKIATITDLELAHALVGSGE